MNQTPNFTFPRTSSNAKTEQRFPLLHPALKNIVMRLQADSRGCAYADFINAQTEEQVDISAGITMTVTGPDSERYSKGRYRGAFYVYTVPGRTYCFTYHGEVLINLEVVQEFIVTVNESMV